MKLRADFIFILFGIIVIIFTYLYLKDFPENYTELGLSGAGGSGNGFNSKYYIGPIFINFYPNIMGADFKLNDIIRKLSLTNNTPTLYNGFKLGIFTNSGHGQTNIGPSKLPIVIVPDIGLSRIYARWSKQNTSSVKKLDASGLFQQTDSWKCRDTQSTFTQIWPPIDTNDLSEVCWSENIAVSFEKSGSSVSGSGEPGPSQSGSVINSQGLTSSVDEMGILNFGNTYEQLLRGLHALGYTDGITLFGANYDFRKILSIDDLVSWTSEFMSMVENSVRSLKKKVIIIGHGFGAVLINYVLVNTDKAWKDFHIDSFCVINGSFGGSPKALRTLLSGSDNGNSNSRSDVVSRPVLRNSCMSFTGLQMLLPNKDVFGMRPLLTYKQQTYAAKDIPKLLKIAGTLTSGSSDSMDIFQNIVGPSMNGSLMAPNVRTYILAGTNIPTESNYKYENIIDEPIKNYPKYDTQGPNMTNFEWSSEYNGDGTIPEMCQRIPISWSDKQEKPVHFKFYNGAEHCKILMMSEPMSDLFGLISDLN